MFKEWLKPSAGVVKLFKALVVAIYCVLAGYTTILTGCVGAMPTSVPPMTDKLGYKVPNYKGITTVGINESAYKWEAEKLNFWRTSMDFVNEPAIALHSQAVDWLNIALSAGFFGGTPTMVALALKKVPKGAVSKKDHDKALQAVKTAG